VIIPNEIMQGSEEFKRVFLKAFWDDEGAAMCDDYYDRKGYEHYSKKLEAYCENEEFLKQLLQLHLDLGVPARISRKRICISNREGLTKFRENIDFSEYVIVNSKRSIWYKVPKHVILDYMLCTYIKRPRVFIKSYGCSSNKADTEKLLWYLKKMGARIVNEEESDIVILNSCGVKQPTEDKILRSARDLSGNKKVIMGGCLPKMIDNIAIRVPGIAILDNTSLPSIVSRILKCFLVEYAESPIILNDESGSRVSQVTTNKFIAVTPLSSGCLGNCSYCSTKLARGKLVSYPPEDILKEIEESVKNGAKEVWLTSQDNGCYGFDIGTNLAELLKQVVKVPGDFRVRVGMMNPGYLNKFLDELIKVYQNEKIFKFAHIPVQSGSDKVLKEMRRGYTTKEYGELVKRFRDAMDITISTDIIVGFPTESEEDFKETVKLLKETRPDFLNLSKYWPRKKTEAGEMKQLPRDTVAARSKEVAELFSKILQEKNKSWLGRKCDVTFTEEKKGFSVGRNSLYRPVLVNGENLLGKTCSVKITDTKKSELIGELI
jgi:MiaB-like tRNA modifying enzyme